jgi:hypothetical protein
MLKHRSRHPARSTPSTSHRRAGVSNLDYILVLPLVAFAIPAGKRIIQLSYEMVCTLVAWPMM